MGDRSRARPSISRTVAASPPDHSVVNSTPNDSSSVLGPRSSVLDPVDEHHGRRRRYLHAARARPRPDSAPAQTKAGRRRADQYTIEIAHRALGRRRRRRRRRRGAVRPPGPPPTNGRLGVFVVVRRQSHLAKDAPSRLFGSTVSSIEDRPSVGTALDALVLLVLVPVRDALCVGAKPRRQKRQHTGGNASPSHQRDRTRPRERSVHRCRGQPGARVLVPLLGRVLAPRGGPPPPPSHPTHQGIPVL